MSELNIKLLRSGVKGLIKDETNELTERLAYYLSIRPKLVDFFFNGPLKIDDDIRQRIEQYIKREAISVIDDFISIESIDISFDYLDSMIYSVRYHAKRYYDSHNSPYNGRPIPEGSYTIPKDTELTVQISPETLNK